MSWREGWFGKDGNSGRVVNWPEYDLGVLVNQAKVLPCPFMLQDKLLRRFNTTE